MPKKATPKQGAATKLLGINGKLHELMGTLLQEKVVDEGITTIPANIIPEALKLSLEGQKLTKQYLPNAVELEYHISEATGEQLPGINPLVTTLQKMSDTFEPENNTVVMYADMGDFLNDTVINWLSNLFHDVAGKLVGATGQIQACSASTIDPEEMATVAKYCSGVLTKALVTTVPLKYLPTSIAGKKKVVQHYPTNIIHSLGIQQHKVETSTHTAGEKPLVAIEYHDSYSAGHPGSVARLKGVKGRLEKEGLLCFAQHPSLYCSGPIEAEKLTNLAAFFSLVIDADISHMNPTDIVPVVSDGLWDFVGELVLKHGEDTWKSGQGHINWGAMRQKWLQDKEILEKSKIYGDLKQLAIYRDKHHELENAMGVDVGTHAPKKAVTDIAANAEKAITLSKKNKWGGSYLSQAQSLLEQFKASGSGSTSDLMGNTIHNILISALSKLKIYGNCPTGANLADINAGALSYCEGTLKGTTTILEGGGSQPLHKVAPKQYKTIIIDENPEGGYDVHVPIDTGFWSGELADYLQSKFGFDCKSMSYGSWKAGKVCNVHIDSHDKIRLLAIFLSNLKGGSDAIGMECVPIAFESAWKVAQVQAKKGVMAFTQEPVVETAKQWIDDCYKTHGIMPPGLTEEQKTLMQLIGPDKIYAGCDLSAEGTVPNMGIISYCEGVRTNPQAVVSAYLTPQGNLSHFFHGETDKLADILVNPLEAGKYAIEIKNIDMRKPEVTDEVIKRLKLQNYDCQGNTCSKEIDSQDIRKLAMLLSSLHQVHHLKGPQVAQAVTLAVNKIQAIPNDKTAYEKMVYPYTAEDWKKELGKAPAEPIKAVIQPPVPAGVVYPKLNWQYVNSLPKKGKPPWDVGGCVSYVSAGPTKIKLGYCAGVVKEAIDSDGNKIAGPLNALLTSKGDVHPIAGDGDIIFDSKWSTLYITLPDELAKIKPLVEGLENKLNFKHTGETTWHKPATPLHAARVGYFFSQLHNITTLPESCWGDAVQHALDQVVNVVEPPLKPVYPFKTEDWMKYVCKIEKPVEKPPEVDAFTFKWHGPTEEFLSDGVWTVPKAHVAELLGKGISEANIIIILTHEVHWKDLGIGEIPTNVAEELLKVIAAEKPEVKPIGKPSLEEALAHPWVYTASVLYDFGVITGNISKCFATAVEKLATTGWKNDSGYFVISSENWGGKPSHIEESTGLSKMTLLTLWSDCVDEWKGEAAPTEKPPQPIDELIVKSLETMQKAHAQITVDDMKKAKETTAYKKLPKKVKDWMHLAINNHLLISHKNKVTLEQMISGLNYLFIELNKIPITPLMIKLQMQIEKKSKIRKGELPAEPGEIVEETLEDDSPAGMKKEVLNYAKVIYDSGKTGLSNILLNVKDNFGLKNSLYLTTFIGDWLVGYQKEVDKSNEPVLYAKLPEDMKFLLHQAISEKAAEGKDVETIDAEIMEQFNVQKFYKWQEIVRQEVKAYQGLMAKKKAVKTTFIWDDIAAAEKKHYILEAYGWAKGNPAYEKEQIMALFESKYNFASTAGLAVISQQVVDSAKAKSKDLIIKEKYTKPWESTAGWQQVPLEIAACMGEILNTKIPGTSISGLYIPLINTKTPGFESSDIEKWWAECVKQYEAGLEKPKGKPVLHGQLLENWILSYLEANPALELSPEDMNITIESHSEIYSSPGVIEVKAALDELVQEGKILWNLSQGTYIAKEPTGKIPQPQELKDWLYNMLKEHPTWKISPKGAGMWMHDISPFEDPGEVAVKAMFEELVQEGKIVWELSSGMYIFEAPAGKVPGKYPELPDTSKDIIKHHMASLISEDIDKIKNIKEIRNVYYLALDGLSELWNELVAEKAIEKVDEELLPSIVLKCLKKTPFLGYSGIEDCVSEVGTFDNDDIDKAVDALVESGKVGVVKDIEGNPSFALVEEEEPEPGPEEEEEVGLMEGELSPQEIAMKEEIEPEVPTIAQLMDAEPKTAEEVEQLTVFLLNQNKFSANEISKAIAGKYAVKDDLSLTEWIVKIKDHHGLKVQLGPKFGELGEESKTDIINYIVEQSDYPEEEIVSFVYGTHGVMADDELLQAISKVKKGLEYFEEPDLTPWADLTSEQQHDFAQKVKDEDITGWDELEKAATESGIVPDEDALPTVMELRELTRKKKEKVAYLDYINLTSTTKEWIAKAVANFVDAGMEEHNIYKQIAADFNLSTDEANLTMVEGFISGYKIPAVPPGQLEISEQLDAFKVGVLKWAKEHATGSLDTWVSMVHEQFDLIEDTPLEEFLKPAWLEKEGVKGEEAKEELHEIGEESDEAKQNILQWAKDHGVGTLNDWVKQVGYEFVMAPDEALGDFLATAWLEQPEKKEKKATSKELADFIFSKLHDAEGEKYDWGQMVKEVQIAWDVGENMVLATLDMLYNTGKIKKDEGGYYYLSGVEEEAPAAKDWEKAITEYMKEQKEPVSLSKIMANFGMAKNTNIVGTPFGKALKVLIWDGIISSTPGVGYKFQAPGEEKPEALISLKDMTGKMNHAINLDVASMVDDNVGKDDIFQTISDNYGLADDAETNSWLDGVIEYHLSGLKKEPAAPSPEQMVKYDEMIKAYYQKGWTPAAVIEFLSIKQLVPADVLKKTANKLYKIYKPEVVRITQEYEGIPDVLKEHLKGVASKLLNEGKGVADVAWYISVNYGIEKASVKVMVRKVAEKPLSQVEAAVKAMQFLEVGAFIGGCRITETMSELTPQNVAYCQGVLDKKGEFQAVGHSILHAMGHQEIQVFSDLTDGKWETKIILETDGGEGNKEKLQGVWDILGNLMNCQYPGGKVVTCQLKGEDGMTLPIAAQDKLRKTALFLSSIDNVALLDKACIPYALKHAMESAKKKNETTKPWTIMPYPDAVEDWNTIVCSKILA